MTINKCKGLEPYYIHIYIYIYIYIYIWDSVQLNHPYGTFQNKQKKSNARIEMYG